MTRIVGACTLFLGLLGACAAAGRTSPPMLSSGPQDQGQDKFESLDGVGLEEVTLRVHKATGVKFLWTDELGLNRKKIYFHSDKPIEKKEDLFRVYQSILQMNDLILVPVRGVAGPDVMYKIQPVQYGPKRPTPFVQDASDPADRFVTRVFSLKHVSPSAVHQAVINMVTLPQGVFPIDSAGVLLITDYDYNIRRFEKIIETVDKPRADVLMEVVPLQHRDPEELQPLVHSLLETLLMSESKATASRPGVYPDAVKVVSDKGTKSLVILASEGRLAQIKRLIEKLDVAKQK